MCNTNSFVKLGSVTGCTPVYIILNYITLQFYQDVQLSVNRFGPVVYQMVTKEWFPGCNRYYIYIAMRRSFFA